MRLWEGVEREEVFLGVFLQELADLSDCRLESLQDLGHALAGLFAVLGGEQLSEGRGDQPALGRPAVLVHIPDEMHGAALPRARQDTLDRVLQSFVMVGDRQAHPVKAACPQGADELDPERLGLDLADIKADHLPHP